MKGEIGPAVLLQTQIIILGQRDPGENGQLYFPFGLCAEADHSKQQVSEREAKGNLRYFSSAALSRHDTVFRSCASKDFPRPPVNPCEHTAERHLADGRGEVSDCEKHELR
jgi:hypothetical protein